MAGIYIHIPYCRQACHYCDFHFSTTRNSIPEMVLALEGELRIRSGYLNGQQVHSVYFGGGTPSILEPEAIAHMLSVIHELFDIHPDAEITLEANPDDLTLSYLTFLRESGINRLSIGVQSFSDKDLLVMNRVHTAEQALQSIENAVKAGFQNLTIDLIYGTPGMSDSQWNKNLDIAFSIGLNHLSCYSLTVEPRTALASFISTGKMKDVDDGQATRQFLILMDRAAGAGFIHYEISNFGKEGFFSRHNTSYWSGSHYLGIGPSAHSFDGLSRQWNVSSNPEYIRSLKAGKVPFVREELTRRDRYNEYILTSLRMHTGINGEEILEKFGDTKRKDFLQAVSPFLISGEIFEFEGRYILTRKGKLMADRITSELFLW